MPTTISPPELGFRHELFPHPILERQQQEQQQQEQMPDVAQLPIHIPFLDLLQAARHQIHRGPTSTDIFESQLVGDGLHVVPSRAQRELTLVEQRPRPPPRARVRVRKITVIGSRVLRQRTAEYFASRDGNADRRRIRLHFDRIRMARLGERSGYSHFGYNDMDWLADADDDEETDESEPEVLDAGYRATIYKQQQGEQQTLLGQQRLLSSIPSSSDWNLYVSMLCGICLEDILQLVYRELFFLKVA